MPNGLMASGHLPTGVYERALKFLSGDAYFSPGYLVSSLEVDDRVGRILLDRLKEDGLVGMVGRMDMMFSKNFYKEQRNLVRQALQINSAALANQEGADLKKTADSLKDLRSEQANEGEFSSNPNPLEDTPLQADLDCDEDSAAEDDPEQDQMKPSGQLST